MEALTKLDIRSITIWECSVHKMMSDEKTKNSFLDIINDFLSSEHPVKIEI